MRQPWPLNGSAAERFSWYRQVAEVAEQGEGDGVGAEELLGEAWTSAGVTASISAMISSTEKKRPKYISWRARLDMRLEEDSRPRTMLDLSWSLARLSSASETVSLLEAAELGEGEVEDLGGLVRRRCRRRWRARRCRGRGWSRSRWSRRGLVLRGWTGRGGSSCRRRAWC